MLHLSLEQSSRNYRIKQIKISMLEYTHPSFPLNRLKQKCTYFLSMIWNLDSYIKWIDWRQTRYSACLMKSSCYLQTFEDFLQCLNITKINLKMSRNQGTKTTSSFSITTHRYHTQGSSMKTAATGQNESLQIVNLSTTKIQTMKISL